MKVLLLGFSRIAQRRVLPALRTLGAQSVDIASRTNSARVVWPDGLGGEVFDDYGVALERSNADLVYISCANNMHAHWAGKALEQGFNVVVDKPLATGPDSALRLLELAERHGRCIAEATVYAWHPQVMAVHKAFADAAKRPDHVIAAFSFPPLPDDNFRYQEEMGGGALLDLGVYATSLGRLFFGTAPEKIAGCVTARRRGLETAFSMLALYGEGRTVTGHFGFTTQYINNVRLLGEGISVSLDRIFTIPSDMDNKITVRQGMRCEDVAVPAADCFAAFLSQVWGGIRSGDVSSFADTVLADARSTDQLRAALGQVNKGRSRV